MKKRRLQTRNNHTEDLNYRGLNLPGASPGGPFTINAENRTVDVVAATENPVMVMDYLRWELIQEVLLMSGCKIPQSRQIPLLDAHSRYSSSDVIGSARDLRVEGDQLVCRAHFSSVAPAPDIFTNVSEGHLTDFSIGYRVNKSVWVPENQSQIINGRTFQGPVRVATDWTVKELSTTPIGADEQAKARSEHQKPQKEAQMPIWLRTWLEGRNLYRENMTEAEGRALFDAQEMKRAESAPPPAAPPIDENALRAEAARAEQDRIIEIRSMCERFECGPEVMNPLIEGMKPVEEARKAIMDAFLERKKTQESPGYSPPVEPGQDERDKFRSAALDGLILRGGATIEKPAPGAEELRGYTLREMARECLKRAGQPMSANVLELVGRALISSDLPNLLAATANKYLFEGYQQQDESWKVWCATGSVNDFKANTINRASETDDLEEVPEYGEYKYGDMKDAKETYQIATYGKMLAISRQAIINDDLNALTDIPRKHGESAARKIGDLPYTVLTANAAMGDGTTLFHADHGNIMTSAALGAVSLANGIALMKLQKDIAGKSRLNIRPEYAIAPVALEGSWEQFFNSGQIGGATATDAGRALLINPYAGSRFTRVYDARLDASSSTHWYLAGPKGKTITVFFLNGVQAPYMETRNGWSVDGVEYKVRIDAVAKAVDWKALAYNAI